MVYDRFVRRKEAVAAGIAAMADARSKLATKADFRLGFFLTFLAIVAFGGLTQVNFGTDSQTEHPLRPPPELALRDLFSPNANDIELFYTRMLDSNNTMEEYLKELVNRRQWATPKRRYLRMYGARFGNPLRPG